MLIDESLSGARSRKSHVVMDIIGEIKTVRAIPGGRHVSCRINVLSAVCQQYYCRHNSAKYHHYYNRTPVQLIIINRAASSCNYRCCRSHERSAYILAAAVCCIISVLLRYVNGAKVSI